jgi:hypothetical protein
MRDRTPGLGAGGFVLRVPSLVEGDAGKEAFVGYLGSGKGKEGKGVGVTATLTRGGGLARWRM